VCCANLLWGVCLKRGLWGSQLFWCAWKRFIKLVFSTFLCGLAIIFNSEDYTTGISVVLVKSSSFLVLSTASPHTDYSVSQIWGNF
jgi:hypothetical protein